MCAYIYIYICIYIHIIRISGCRPLHGALPQGEAGHVVDCFRPGHLTIDSMYSINQILNMLCDLKLNNMIV